jgi:hypothetical protein
MHGGRVVRLLIEQILTGLVWLYLAPPAFLGGIFLPGKARIGSQFYIRVINTFFKLVKGFFLKILWNKSIDVWGGT